ncbi:MAG: 1-acyl-sn-glycerol-3-phosphate acyltransferase [Ruminococcus sp.]|nr:1-acyl-sn-glycerol-3-phosphate acyltransferase [Ruminococcus sp.]
MYSVIKFLLRLAFGIAYSLQYEGRENIPKRTAVIYASNHRTNADPPLVGAGARGKHSFMAKEELFRNKLFGWLIRSLGAFPVARGKGDTAVIDTSVERLKSGRNLMIFPEGTRSKTGKVGRGHSGAALIAARSGALIVPVGVCFGEKLKFRTRITVKYGEPIDPKDYVEISDEPNPRQLVKLKNKYMEEIKKLVEGEPENAAAEEVKEDE